MLQQGVLQCTQEQVLAGSSSLLTEKAADSLSGFTSCDLKYWGGHQWQVQAHLAAREHYGNVQDTKDEAGNLSKEGHAIGGAFHPRGVVGAQNYTTA